MRVLTDRQIKVYKVVMWVFAFIAICNLVYGEWLIAGLDTIIALYAHELYKLNTEIKNYVRVKDALDSTYIDID